MAPPNLDSAAPHSGSATRADRISELLADEIMSGQLSPGQRLDESELAERFAVSRTPVREALRELDAMGLVTKRPHCGVEVASVSIARLQEMFTVMAEVESACARFAAEHMNAAERRDLDKLHRSSAVLVRNGATKEYAAHNSAFHAAIYRGTHNWFMEETALWIRRRVSPFRKAQFQVSARLRLSYEEHGAVVQAILRGDVQGAGDAMLQHMQTVSDASARYVGEPAETP